MKAYLNQTSTSEPTVYAQYLYSGGQRVKKLVRTSGGGTETTVYIDGVFEHKYDGTNSQSIVRVGGVASVRTGYAFDGLSGTNYELSNHLGSVSIRLDSNGSIIDKEEYYPFGDSSVRTWDKKRYRYVGKEKDAESGLYYYGARYYSAWTCRFISVDPLARDYPQLTSYNYASNAPINSLDIDGMQNPNERTSEDSNQDNGSEKPMGSTNEQSTNTIEGSFTLYKTSKLYGGGIEYQKTTYTLKDGKLTILREKEIHNIDGEIVESLPESAEYNYSDLDVNLQSMIHKGLTDIEGLISELNERDTVYAEENSRRLENNGLSPEDKGSYDALNASVPVQIDWIGVLHKAGEVAGEINSKGLAGAAAAGSAANKILENKAARRNFKGVFQRTVKKVTKWLKNKSDSTAKWISKNNIKPGSLWRKFERFVKKMDPVYGKVGKLLGRISVWLSVFSSAVEIFTGKADAHTVTDLLMSVGLSLAVGLGIVSAPVALVLGLAYGVFVLLGGQKLIDKGWDKIQEFNSKYGPGYLFKI